MFKKIGKKKNRGRHFGDDFFVRKGEGKITLPLQEEVKKLKKINKINKKLMSGQCLKSSSFSKIFQKKRSKSKRDKI